MIKYVKNKRKSSRLSNKAESEIPNRLFTKCKSYISQKESLNLVKKQKERAEKK